VRGDPSWSVAAFDGRRLRRWADVVAAAADDGLPLVAYVAPEGRPFVWPAAAAGAPPLPAAGCVTGRPVGAPPVLVEPLSESALGL
jgi:hypothetical protein